MTRAITVLIIFLLTSKLPAQNLLPNGGLNDRNICTEFHAACAPEAWFFIPTYVKFATKENSNPFEVISMGLPSKSAPGFRNYLYTKILCTLKRGKQYKFSLWVNTNNPFDHLDVWAGNYEPGKKGPSVFITQPTFTVTPQQEDGSKTNWTKYTYVYTAKGGEQFLMLGNLSAEAMPALKKKFFSKMEPVLYGVDDISLTALDTSEKLCTEYDAVLKQTYDLNKRHPPGFIEDVALDKSLTGEDTPALKKEIIWVIVDTPPSLRKKLNDTLTVPDVLFLYNSSKLNPSFIKDLDNIIQKLKETTFKQLEITGHTDNKGKPAYNVQLSIERANAIKDYLVRRLNISLENVTIKGLGESSPIATNETSEGRQKNRRVEIIVKH